VQRVGASLEIFCTYNNNSNNNIGEIKISYREVAVTLTSASNSAQVILIETSKNIRTTSMGNSTRGRAPSISAEPATQAQRTMMGVRGHQEPGESNHGPKLSRPRGMSLDQGKTRTKPRPEETQAMMTMLPVRSHDEHGGKSHHAPSYSRPRGMSIDQGKTKPPSVATRPAVATRPTALARPEETLATMTMMPVRGHQEPGQTHPPSRSRPRGLSVDQGNSKPRADLTPKPSKRKEASTRERGTRTTKQTGGKGRSEGKGKSKEKKPSFLRRLFGMGEKESAAPKSSRLGRSAAIGGGATSRHGHDTSYCGKAPDLTRTPSTVRSREPSQRRLSYDVSRAPSTVRGPETSHRRPSYAPSTVRGTEPSHRRNSYDVGVTRTPSQTNRGTARSRPVTTYGAPSTDYGYTVYDSDESDSSLSSDDDDGCYEYSTGGYNGIDVVYEPYHPSTGGYNGPDTVYETYHPPTRGSSYYPPSSYKGPNSKW